MSLTKLFIISSMKSTLAEAKLEQTIQFMSTEAKDYEDSTVRHIKVVPSEP